MDEQTKIEFRAEQKLEGLANVRGVAYSGDAIAQYWSNTPIVVNLAGMEMAAQIPLLLSHENHPSARLGVVDATVADGKLEVVGKIDTSDPAGAAIVERGKKIAWQLSIGAENLKSSLVEEGSVEVNGRQFNAPVRVVEKSRLREVSVVAVGADAETVLQIAAAAQLNIVGGGVPAQQEKPKTGVNPMDEKEKVDTSAEISKAVQAARDEITAVLAITADYPEIQKKAIASNWTQEHAKDVVEAVKAVEAKRPVAPANIITKTAPEIDAKAIEAALCLNAGIDEKVIAKSCGEAALDLADTKLRGLGLRGAVEAAAKMEGKETGYGFGDTAIRAGLSTVSLPGILSNVANKAAMRAYQDVPGTAARLSRKGSLSDFKTAYRYRMSEIGDLEEVANGGELKHGTLGEESATNKLATYGKMFSLSRQMIYNDDLGEFLRIPSLLGARAKRKVETLFYTLLLSNPTLTDGVALFHNTHKNVLTTGALATNTLEAGITKFAKQTDSEGNPIAVAPRYLLVPPELEPTAKRIVNSQYLVGGSTAAPELNVVSTYGLSVISSPYLSHAAFTGNSQTAWYLWADPSAIDTFEIAYLNGREAPVVETADLDFNQLGIQFRCYFDVGIAPQDFRGVAKNAGA